MTTRQIDRQTGAPNSSDGGVPTGDPSATVGDSGPNYGLRRTLLAAGIGFLGLTGFLGVRAALNAHHQDALNAELSHPFGDVAAAIQEGEIDADDVTRFRIGDREYAWTAASQLTHADHQGDTSTVSSIIEAQQGNPVQQGATVILPNSAVDHPQP